MHFHQQAANVAMQASHAKHNSSSPPDIAPCFTATQSSPPKKSKAPTIPVAFFEQLIVNLLIIPNFCIIVLNQAAKRLGISNGITMMIGEALKPQLQMSSVANPVKSSFNVFQNPPAPIHINIANQFANDGSSNGISSRVMHSYICHQGDFRQNIPIFLF